MIDTRLPMMVQQPNFLSAMQQGTQLAGNENALRRVAEMQQLSREYGPGIAAGDPNAMNALAQFDPGMAFDMGQQRAQGQRAERGLQISEAQLAMARDEAARAAERHAATMSAEDRAREAAAIERGLMQMAPLIAQARDTGDVTALNQALRTFGMEPVADANAALLLAAQYGGVAEVLKRADELMPQEAAPLSPEGKLAADLQAGRITQEQFDAASNNQPLVDMSGANFGPQAPDVTDKFYERLDTGQAEMFISLLNEGTTLPQNLARLDQLDALLASAPSGAEGAIKYAAGQFGINTEGLDELQAAQALISQLVPAQRPPGSGPMSDADLLEFKKSLPRLINQPGGNKLILDTMRGIMIYQLQQSDIAAKVASRELTPAEGREQLRSLKNPLEAVRQPGATTIGGYTIEEVTE